MHKSNDGLAASGWLGRMGGWRLEKRTDVQDNLLWIFLDKLQKQSKTVTTTSNFTRKPITYSEILDKPFVKARFQRNGINDAIHEVLGPITSKYGPA